MSPEVIAALISGLVGVIAGGILTYIIESKKMSVEGISRPSNILHEKRVAFCEEMIIAADKAAKVAWNIWELTEHNEEIPEEVAKESITGIIMNDTLEDELARILSLCKIYGNAPLIEAFSQLRGQYRELMDDATHTVATATIDKTMPIVNAIRTEIGTDVLSKHILDQLRVKEDMFSVDHKT
mgnify:CR=1 FL=1